MERKRRVKTYEIVYICDECKKGEVENTNITITTNPPIHKHRCNNCDKEYEFVDKIYPHTITERIIAQSEGNWEKDS